MNTLIVLIVVTLTSLVSANPIETETKINGETGWYVPQVEDTFKWFWRSEAEELINEQKSIIKARKTQPPVHFFMLNNQNPDKQITYTQDIESIKASGFNPLFPTIFTVHGWRSSGHDDWHLDIAHAWFKHGSYNVIAVDWEQARTINYFSAQAYVPTVGQEVAAVMTYLNKNFGLPWDAIQCVGHSLGAHVCGFAGKNIQGKMNTIVALDAAFPLFDYNKPTERVNSEDASYVESIHTNGGVLGFLPPIGTMAFYPNGGRTQPGCGFDLIGTCSHGRSHEYYRAALLLNNFPAIKCQNQAAATAKTCGATYSSTFLGGSSNYLLGGGQFYVPVNKDYPYGMGKY